MLLRFRCYEIGLVWDLSKAYNSILTTLNEFFTRLVVWQGKTYGFTCVAFGDQPASILLELTKEVAADKGKEVDEMTALKLV